MFNECSLIDCIYHTPKDETNFTCTYILKENKSRGCGLDKDCNKYTTDIRVLSKCAWNDYWGYVNKLDNYGEYGTFNFRRF